MKKKSILVVAALLAAGVVGQAAAHERTIHFTHLVRLSAPGVAEGRQVEAVTARVGIWAVSSVGQVGGHVFWYGTQSVDLERRGDHFFGKAVLRVTQGPGSPRLGGVLREFTLRFADGSDLTLREDFVRQVKSRPSSDFEAYWKAVAEELEAFNGQDDAEESSCVTVSVMTDSAFQF